MEDQTVSAILNWESTIAMLVAVGLLFWWVFFKFPGTASASEAGSFSDGDALSQRSALPQRTDSGRGVPADERPAFRKQLAVEESLKINLGKIVTEIKRQISARGRGNPDDLAEIQELSDYMQKNLRAVEGLERIKVDKSNLTKHKADKELNGLFKNETQAIRILDRTIRALVSALNKKNFNTALAEAEKALKIVNFLEKIVNDELKFISV